VHRTVLPIPGGRGGDLGGHGSGQYRRGHLRRRFWRQPHTRVCHQWRVAAAGRDRLQPYAPIGTPPRPLLSHSHGCWGRGHRPTELSCSLNNDGSATWPVSSVGTANVTGVCNPGWAVAPAATALGLTGPLRTCQLDTTWTPALFPCVRTCIVLRAWGEGGRRRADAYVQCARAARLRAVLSQ
jgi:hypothetical protein